MNSSQKVPCKWIGYPTGTFTTAESFLNVNGIPYLKILGRAALVYFPELKEHDLVFLRENGWQLRPNGSQHV